VSKNSSTKKSTLLSVKTPDGTFDFTFAFATVLVAFFLYFLVNCTGYNLLMV
jgi:hypothetical protein